MRNADMRLHKILVLALGCAVALHGAVRAQAPGSAAPDVQVQLGDLLYADGRFADAADAYRRAVHAPDPATAVRAGAGVVLALLRRGDFQEAFTSAADLRRTHPDSAAIAAAHGDALWSYGLFEE